MKLSHISLSSVLCVVGLSLSGCSEPTMEHSAAPGNDSNQQAASSVAFINPETGELTSQPSPANKSRFEQLQQTEAYLPPVQVITHPDGSVVAKLNGRFRSPLVATIGCDGNTTMEHNDPDKVELKTECSKKE